MKVDFISDLHLDFWLTEINTQSPKFSRQLSKFIYEIEPNLHDVLVIAGDLGHHFKQNAAFLLKMKEFYNNIVLVAGNHDYYLISNSVKERYHYNSWNRIQEMKNFSEENGIFYLDGNIVGIDNVSFGGTCMSWDTSFARSLYPNISHSEIENIWKSSMNDYSNIYQEDDLFNPFSFLDKELMKLNAIKDVDIMVTHYGPKVPSNLASQYHTITSTFYFFDGIKHIKRIHPRYWIHGHTHDQVNDMLYGCNILCNPLGYPAEDTKASIKTITI